jgi:transposase
MGKEVSETKRAQICVLHSIGWGYKRIAAHEGMARSTVATICRRYAGTDDFSTKPRAGRPTKVNEEDIQALNDKIEANPDITYKELKDSLVGNDVSERTIKRRLARKKTRVEGGGKGGRFLDGRSDNSEEPSAKNTPVKGTPVKTPVKNTFKREPLLRGRPKGKSAKKTPNTTPQQPLPQLLPPHEALTQQPVPQPEEPMSVYDPALTAGTLEWNLNFNHP